MNDGAASARGHPVARRHVLFFGGFDPKGASWYHALYSRHAKEQAAVNGLELEVGLRKRDAQGRMSWQTVSCDADAVRCESTIEVVSWDALVRQHWPRHGLRLLLDTVIAYARIIRNGIPQLIKVGRIAPRTLFAMLYPLLFFVLAALLSAVAAIATGVLAARVAGSTVAGVLAAALVLWGCTLLVLRIERWLDTGLLARIYSFVARYGLHGLPQLDAVVAAATARIVELADDPQLDEVLVVGYSVGSILATRALGRALPSLGEPVRGAPQLALLTLGHCIPLFGLFPQAHAYRAELAVLGSSNRLKWVDVSSPTDWGSFPLLNPIEVCEVEVAQRGKGWPLMTSPRFHTLFEPASYQEMLGNKHRMHTQYLMSTEKPGRYDYFAITAGPQSLRARYARARETQS